MSTPFTVTTISALREEYTLLQDKIDKIGAFRVTIKGWSVTATVGALVAIASGKGFSPKISSLATDVLLAWFFWFEREQVSLSWFFGGRARLIEIQIDKLRRADGEKAFFATPNIARSSSTGKNRSVTSRTPSRPEFLVKLRLLLNRQVKLALKSDAIFYLVLGVAAWLPTWFNIPTSPSEPVVIQNVIQTPPQPISTPTNLVHTETPNHHDKARVSK